MSRLTPLFLLSILFLTSCATTNPSGPLVDARNAQIANESPGDYYIGRRFHIERTHFWGYLRRPRQPLLRSFAAASVPAPPPPPPKTDGWRRVALY